MNILIKVLCISLSRVEFPIRSGQIRIADDFDSMPDDSAVPFGYPKNR